MRERGIKQFASVTIYLHTLHDRIRILEFKSIKSTDKAKRLAKLFSSYCSYPFEVWKREDLAKRYYQQEEMNNSQLIEWLKKEEKEFRRKK